MGETIKKNSLWTWLRPHRFKLFLGVFCVVVVVAVDASLPLMFGKYLVDGVLLTEESYGMLQWMAIGGALLFLLKGIFMYGQVYLMSGVGQHVVFELRSHMYRHLLDLPLERHHEEKSGNIVSRMTSDVGVIQNAISAGVAEMIQHTLTLVVTITMLFVLNWRLALISMTMLPVALLAIQGYGSRIRSFTTRLQEGIADLTATLQESLEGIRIVKAFRMEEERRKRFEQGNKRSLSASMKAVQAMATVSPVMELILILGMMIVVWFGGRAVIRGTMSVGELVSFLAYLGMASRPVSFLTKSFNLLQQARAASERISHIMDEPVEEDAGQSTGTLQQVNGHIAFSNVTFSYETGRPVLNNISIEALPGETIALVGRSGAGKSTLVNLIPRFYSPDLGVIRLDGRDIATLDLGFLRRSIGLVPQETLLFGMSVAENIRAGRDWIDDDAVYEAAKLANAHEFIDKMAEGYDTIVGERGATLSGGQRQRVAIARAIAGNPRILILDEATSALDSESESLVRDALMRVQRGRTTLIIAHRLSTVIGANKIVVLGRGRVIEVGTHAELLRSGKLYPKLYKTQFADSEGPFNGHYEESDPDSLKPAAVGGDRS